MTEPLSIPLTDEEPVASVLRTLQLTPLGNDRFTALSLPQVRRVYGGQVLAQGLLAAAATVPDRKRLPHSLHAYFLRGGDPELPFDIEVARLRDGRSFSNRRCVAIQDGREISSMTTSFQVVEDGLSSTPPPPTVPDPHDLPSALELFRTLDHPVAKFLGKTAAFDVRHVQGSLYTGPDPKQRHTQELWMKIRSPIAPGTAQVIQRALLAYVVDQVMLEPALRATGLSWLTPGLSLASLDHAMWFHADVDINEWLLFAGRADAVGGGRAKAGVDIFNPRGDLIATASQEGMVRIPTSGHTPSSRWSFDVPVEP